MFYIKRCKKIFLTIFSIALMGVLLPWFSFNPELTGYHWGFYGLQYEIVQITAVYLLCHYVVKNSVIIKISAELLLISFPVVYIWQLMSWHSTFITGKISLSIGLRTAQPTFWIALVLSAIPAVMFPILCQKGRSDKSSEKT